uniref:Uncharacterized protein n=1 Tax=Setaria digitata TaxID=48799 RepID=A0A915Q0S4_9BILA
MELGKAFEYTLLVILDIWLQMQQSCQASADFQYEAATVGLSESRCRDALFDINTVVWSRDILPPCPD